MLGAREESTDCVDRQEQAQARQDAIQYEQLRKREEAAKWEAQAVKAEREAFTARQRVRSLHSVRVILPYVCVSAEK